MKLQLNGKNESITNNAIEIMKEIYQGDILSVILFVLSLNPLSHLLEHSKGYAYGENPRQQHTHNFFVTDLKLYLTKINNIEYQLDIVTTFSKDIGMTFAINKCGIYTSKKSGSLIINNFIIQPVATVDNNRYLYLDENIECN